MIRLCAFADEAAKNLDEQIAALNQNEISLLEIRSVNGKNIKDVTLKDAKEYQKIIADGGVQVWSVGSPLGKIEIDTDFNKYLDTVKHICELANIFKADKIRMFSFFNAYNSRNLVLDYLCKMVETGKKFNVYMCHENEKDIYGDTLERVVDLTKNVKGLKFIYDPANFIQCNQNMDDCLNTLFDCTEYFHIKDVIKETGELVPAGHGDGKIDKLIERIGGRDTVLTLEPHLALFSGYGAIDSSKMKNKYVYKSNLEAFNAAVSALKKMLKDGGYIFKNGGFVK